MRSLYRRAGHEISSGATFSSDASNYSFAKFSLVIISGSGSIRRRRRQFGPRRELPIKRACRFGGRCAIYILISIGIDLFEMRRRVERKAGEHCLVHVNNVTSFVCISRANCAAPLIEFDRE